MEKIRRLNEGEGLLYRSIRLESLRESPDAFSSKYEDALERSEESWNAQADSTATGSDRATFVCIDKEPIGLAALYRDESETEVGELIQMWVSPDYRGTSVANDLLSEIFRWTASNGFSRIKAEVMNGNKRALTFYEKFGFVPSEELTAHADSSLMLTKQVEQVASGQRR